MYRSSIAENPYLNLNSMLRHQRKRKAGVLPINKERETLGEYHKQFQHLKEDDDKFFQYTRMHKRTFDIILNAVRPCLQRKTTNFRRPISPEERLVITLRFMATGQSYHSIAFDFRVGVATVSGIVKETARIIWEQLNKKYMPFPTEDVIKQSERQFSKKWNFPNCFGCVDEKHIKVKNPAHFSIALQGLANANSKFITIDVGAYGKQSEGGVFHQSSLGIGLENGTLSVPPPKALPNQEKMLPYVILGDKAYPLTTYLMRPFPKQDLNIEKKVFNYRLSRARRCVECAFGILFSKWRFLLNELEISVENSKSLVKCACLLHNVIIEEEGLQLDDYDENMKFAETNDIICQQRANRGTNLSIDVRNTFMEFFMSPDGELRWQKDII